MLKKMTFFKKKYPHFLAFFAHFHPPSTIPFFSADCGRFFYSFKKCLTLGYLSTNELDFFQKNQNCPWKPNFAKKKTCFLALFIHFCSFFPTKHNTLFFGRFSYSFMKCLTLGCLSTNELDFFQKSQNCFRKRYFTSKKNTCVLTNFVES